MDARVVSDAENAKASPAALKHVNAAAIRDAGNALVGADIADVTATTTGTAFAAVPVTVGAVATPRSTDGAYFADYAYVAGPTDGAYVPEPADRADAADVVEWVRTRARRNSRTVAA